MKKSIITMIVALCLVAALGVGATLAYLSDTTDIVTNTFTVGKVDIELTETVGEDTELDGFDYENVIPTVEYDKEPIVTVKAGSAACYVFVEINNTNGTNLTIEDINTTVFTALTDHAGVYYKAVDEVPAAADDLDLPAIFTKVKVGANVDENTELSDITIKAYAIQQEGFGSVADAWDALQDAE